MIDSWILAEAPGEKVASGPVSSEESTTSTVGSNSNVSAPPTTGNRPGFGYGNIILIGLMFVVMWFILFRGPQKKQQEHRKMVQSLEKNDKVRTIGGIIGTVVDVKDDEVTLKIDESTNTKIKVVPSAIGRNLSKDNG